MRRAFDHFDYDADAFDVEFWDDDQAQNNPKEVWTKIPPPERRIVRPAES